MTANDAVIVAFLAVLASPIITWVVAMGWSHRRRRRRGTR